MLGERHSIGDACPRRGTTPTGSAAARSRRSSACRSRDTQCGFRLFKADALRGLPLSARGYEIETEMLVKLRRRGGTIASAPVTAVYDGRPSKLRPIRDTTRTCFLAGVLPVPGAADERRRPAARRRPATLDAARAEQRRASSASPITACASSDAPSPTPSDSWVRRMASRVRAREHRGHRRQPAGDFPECNPTRRSAPRARDLSAAIRATPSISCAPSSASGRRGGCSSSAI